MEMEISCLTILTRESEIVSVYMVYLQGISHQFEISVINAFYNKFWNRFGKFFKRSWFFAFGIWKKASFAFLICYILVVNIYWCFNLLLFRWSRYMINCSWNIFDQVSAIFERLFSRGLNSTDNNMRDVSRGLDFTNGKFLWYFARITFSEKFEICEICKIGSARKLTHLRILTGKKHRQIKLQRI